MECLPVSDRISEDRNSTAGVYAFRTWGFPIGWRDSGLYMMKM